MVAESDLMWVDESCTGTKASPICQIESSQTTTNKPEASATLEGTYQLVRVEVALFAVPIEVRLCVVIVCCAAGSNSIYCPLRFLYKIQLVKE